MKKNFLFLASPNIGIFESWGPILEVLIKTKDIYVIFSKFDLIFRQSNQNHASLKILSRNINKILYQSPIGNWYYTESLSIFKKSVLNIIPDFLFYRIYKKLIYVPFFKNFEKIIFKLFYKSISINNINTHLDKLQFEFLAYDVIEEYKNDNKEWLPNLKIKKIGFETGINFYIYKAKLKEVTHNNRLNLNYMANMYGLSYTTVPYIKNLKVFLVSSNNIDYYKNVYDKNDKEIAVIGVPRNNSKWMKKIFYESDEFKFKLGGSYIFVISRPAQEYFIPISRKKQYIKYIRDVANKYSLKIVIKLHPKESSYFGKKYFYEILGRNNYNINWQFTDKNIYQVAIKSKVCITFYTSTCIDLISLDIPTIEIMNLNGIEEEDNIYSLRDEKKSPITQYRNCGFVLGVENYEELNIQVKEILSNKEKSMKYLKDNYYKYLTNPDDFEKKILNSNFFGQE